MADVFISYKRDERAAVEEIAARLRAMGLQVWFDASLSAGESFNDEIDREARAARLILVCWSPTARESKWVKSEAMIGFEADKLAAAHVAGPDGFSPPAPFNTVHAEDLRAWIAAPSEAHCGWKSVLRRIGKMCARPDIESYGALDAQASASDLRAWIAAHEQSPLFMAVDALLHAREAQDAERARLEQEARARRAKDEQERRAREEEERSAREECEAEARALREVQRRREQEAARAREEAEAQQQRARVARRKHWWVMLSMPAALALIAVLVGSLWRGQEAPTQATEGRRTEGTADGAQPSTRQADCSYAIVRVTAPEGPEGMTAATAALADIPRVTSALPMSAQRVATLVGADPGTLPDLRLIEVVLSSTGGDAYGDIVAALAQVGVTAEVEGLPGCR